MKSDELSFRKAASKGLVGNLKAIYILNPEVLHSTGKTSGKNALAFAVDYQQREAVQWLMAVGAQPTDPTELGSLESFLQKEKLTLKPQEDQITIDDLPLFINNALMGLDFLQQKYGHNKDVFPDQDIEFKRIVDNVRRTINRVYLDKEESSIVPLYIFVNYLQKYFQYNIKKIADSIPVEFSSEFKKHIAWVGLLCSVAILDFIRVGPSLPSYESAIAAYSIIDACNILQLTLLDYEFYATEHESEPDVMALEHVSIQAQLGHTKAKAAARPNLILPQEAITHIDRLNQEYSNSNKQFHGVVLAAKDHEGTLQSEQTVMDKFLLAAMSIKKGAMPRTQFIIYISKNSHAWTVDVSWNHHKNRLEIMSFDMTTHSNQEEFLSNFNAKLAAIKCQAVFAICVAKLQKDFDSCMLYAIKFAQISASLTYSKCCEIKSHALTRGNKLYFEVHHLGEKVIRMGQSKAQMRENLLKHYPDDSQKANGAVQKYDVTKHLESLRRKTRQWRAAQDAQQPMAELEEKMQVLAIDEPNDTHVEKAQSSLDLLDLIDRLEQIKIDLIQPKQSEFATLLEMLNEWQIRAKAGSGKFPYLEQVMSCTLSFPPKKELAFNDKVIVKIKLLQSRIMLGVKNSAHRLILKFKDKNIQIYDISDRDDQDFSTKKQNIDFALKMLRLLTDMGGIIESHMIEVARRSVHPWETITFKTVLQAVPKVADYYVETHQQVAKRVCELVQSQDPIPKEVTVFSFGCGDGAELVLVNDKLRLSGISVKGFGFDINPENFKATAALHKTLTFSKGDIHTLEDSIKAQTFDPNSLKIGLFIGVLTDTILKGTNEALKIIAQTRELDHLYVCGWQNVLLNKNVLRAAGFNVPDVHERRETNEQSYHLNFFELSWMSQDERRDYLQRKSTKRSRENRFDLLDISFSANPLRDLKLFSIDALKNIRMIDISWSYLKANEIQQFFDYLQQINTQKLIVLVSRAQNAYEDILKAAWRIPHVYVHERNDAANINEIPAFTPAQARRWGIYEQLPNTPLKRISLS